MTPLVTVFVRPAKVGAVKTRLAAGLGAEAAARLYVAFASDVFAMLASWPELTVELAVAGAVDDPDLAFCPAGLPRVAQPEGDLGVRMALSLGRGVAQHGRTLLVGTDVPTLPRAHIADALARLDHADVVLGPTADGGYCLIGARRVAAGMFEGVRWSTRHALRDTRASCEAAGLSTTLIGPWYDVDELPDLWTLRAHLAVASEAAPASARALSDLAGISF